MSSQFTIKKQICNSEHFVITLTVQTRQCKTEGCIKIKAHYPWFYVLFHFSCHYMYVTWGLVLCLSRFWFFSFNRSVILHVFTCLMILKLCLCFSQVYKCFPSSRTPSLKAVPAVTGRSRTATCWRLSISTGTRTASSVPAVIADWARWDPLCTPKPISSCVGETTYGKRDRWRFGSKRTQHTKC